MHASIVNAGSEIGVCTGCRFRRRASLLVLERAEHRLLALDAHEDAEDRRRDDDVAHGLVALGEASDVAELRAIVTQNARSGSRRELSLVCVL